MRLKCDLHLHTKEDPRHQLAHNAYDLIDAAADHGYDVLSITNHNTVTYSPELAAYAERQGILLIPGVEATVQGRHVLIYRVDEQDAHWENLTFFDLKRLRDNGAFVIAPHPFYPNYNCLGSHLKRLPGLFDAVEYSHLYTRKFNFNRRAQEFAASHNLPILGLSDAHSLKQLDFTYTLVDANKDVDSVFEAIRDRHITIVTRPARFTTSSVVGIQLFATFLLLQLTR